MQCWRRDEVAGPAMARHFFHAHYRICTLLGMNDSMKTEEGPWSIFYEADGNIHRIGSFDSQDDAQQAAKNAQAEGEFDINDQQVYLVGPDHRMFVLSEEDVVGGGEEYDAELAADQILERQELEDFEGLDPFEGAYEGEW